MGKKKILLHILSNYLLSLISYLTYQIQKVLSSICHDHATSIFDPTISLSLLMQKLIILQRKHIIYFLIFFIVQTNVN